MKKRPKRYVLTYLWCLPAALISWLVVLFIWIFWGTKLQWVYGLWCELKQDSWPARTWYKRWSGTAFVLGGFYKYGKSGEIGIIDTKTERHEHIHVEQGEAAQLVSFLMGLYVFFLLEGVRGAILGAIVWSLGAILYYLSSVIQAWIRGEKPYRGSHLEESARSQAKR